MEALKEYLPRGVDAIIEGYAPYWMGVGQATFVKTLQRIHPGHVRDIWDDRHASTTLIGCNNPSAVSVVAELVDYYCDLMETSCGHSYAYVPVMFDLSDYSDAMASERRLRIHTTHNRHYGQIPHMVPALMNMKIKRLRGLSGRDEALRPFYDGGKMRLDVRPEHRVWINDRRFLYL